MPNRITRCVLPVLLAGLLLLGRVGAVIAEPVTVRTADGPVVGLRTAGGAAFRGIPYAAAPVGPLRFHAPVAPTPWTAPRSATEPAPACPQLPNTDDATEDGDAVQSEDCLTVNVWTPAADAGHRPVMVFIHGGGLYEGSAANSWYDGASLSRFGNVVVVSLQYRLGLLGFLAVGELGGPAYAGSGNSGLLDQIAALQWVQKNAARFGGDQGNVTLFGESAGGASIYALLAQPRARGLFHKAIIESGSVAHVVARERAEAIRKDVFATAGVRTLAELQRLPVGEILRIQDAVLERMDHAMNVFSFIDDGVVLNGPPLTAFARDPAAGVPVLVGTNAEEMRSSIALSALPIDRQPPEVLGRRLATLFGAAGPPLLEVYGRFHPSAAEATTTLLGDIVYRMPAIRFAEMNSERQPTYMYLFTYRSPTRGPSGLEYGALHGLELAPVFGVDSARGYTYVGPKGTWTRLSEQMMSAWTAFARSGDPNTPLVPHWPRYDTKTRATLAFGPHSDVLQDPWGREREAWRDIPTAALENAALMEFWELLPN